MRHHAYGGVAALLAATLSVACGSSSTEEDKTPAPSASSGCSASSDCGSGMGCIDGGVCKAFAVCPSDLQPTYASLRTKVFGVSCGTSGSRCHSHEGFVDSGGLDLADDPYLALLGADKKGEFASNIAGSVRNLRRVVPGDPAHSFLVIKLGTRSSADPRYGAGMPFPTPGSVCPDTLSAVRAWIKAGAKQ